MNTFAALRWALCTISAYALTSVAAVASGGADAPAIAPAPRPTPPSVDLPAGEGAWLVVVTRSGGLTGQHLTYRVNSTGEGSTNGNDLRKVPADLLARVEKHVRAVQTRTWVDGGREGICCDFARTSINLSVRQANGTVLDRSVSWTLMPPTAPNNATALAVAVESALPVPTAVR